MDVKDVRKRYLDFYAKRGHAVIPSAPIIPENDPTTLFTSSGMQPLVPYLLGQPHSEGNRLVNSQMSFRADDIEEIGDNRHTTFFEMLGNWSLGDYFKQEQLTWVFEYLTSSEEGLGLDPKNLYVTVFGGDTESGMMKDEESVEIWKKLFSEKGIEAKFVELDTEEKGNQVGMQGGRIFSFGARKNWWSRAGIPSKMPTGEIGGPDSEIFYDFGLPHNPAFGLECHPNCDCGRFIEVSNSVFMQFIKNADGTFSELPARNVDFGGGLERLSAATRNNPDVFMTDVFDAARAVIETRSNKKYADEMRSFRIILDHMRAASFFIASGIRPANSEQGYVLRRLIRRSIREADKLGITDTVLADVAKGFSVAYAESYPFVQSVEQTIREELEKEEVQFRKTLTQGLKEFDKWYKRGQGYFPDEEGKNEQEAMARFATMPKILPGEIAFNLFTTFGFPIELTQEIAKEREMIVDMDGYSRNMQEHQALSRAGAAQKFAGGLADHSEQTVRYHTAHHILLKALRVVLGKDVHQRGSNITSERLRLDFAYGQKVTPEQLAEVTKIVNEKIAEALPVIRTVMNKEDAEKLNAEHEFGANYPEQVTVYSIGPKDATPEDPKFSTAFSIEFCGGPHVNNTDELTGTFRIIKEEACSAGVRRIKAVLE